MPVYLLSDELIFPRPEEAEENGLLAVGGDLSLKRLLLAYRLGIFPWYSEESPILWWSPDPRLILEPENLKISKSLNKVIKKGIFSITMDQAFEAVIRGCAQAQRPDARGTWIVDDMISAYCRLHQAGFAHSVESWFEGKLVGGLYGVSLGKVFFGESMFYQMKNASKVAFVYLVRLLQIWGFDMIDCQITTSHLINFGAHEIPRSQFLKRLSRALQYETRRGHWSFPEEFSHLTFKSASMSLT
ncbi:MAG: leucyl/phenylalanyl-tRNA--protein transferase [Deltaproteobacteria bacterium]|nr:MAG: leucyl/phenylalanyl-tRNA--protein transferase [Deltaproteobacteria bacterium]